MYKKETALGQRIMAWPFDALADYLPPCTLSRASSADSAALTLSLMSLILPLELMTT